MHNDKEQPKLAVYLTIHIIYARVEVLFLGLWTKRDTITRQENSVIASVLAIAMNRQFEAMP